MIILTTVRVYNIDTQQHITIPITDFMIILLLFEDVNRELVSQESCLRDTFQKLFRFVNFFLF